MEPRAEASEKGTISVRRVVVLLIVCSIAAAALGAGAVLLVEEAPPGTPSPSSPSAGTSPEDAKTRMEALLQEREELDRKLEQAAEDYSASVESTSVQRPTDATVPQDDPSLPRADSAGNTPADTLLAYIRAWNRSDWKTAWSLRAPPKEEYASWARSVSEDVVPWDDFEIHETRIVEPNKALVRVTYSTIGFSSLEGLRPEERRTVVVVREPGEWWVLEKGDTDDGVWKVTSKGPSD